jgi:hypothetical protein
MKKIKVDSIKTISQFAEAHRMLWAEIIKNIEAETHSCIQNIKAFSCEILFDREPWCHCWGCEYNEIYNECLFEQGCMTKLGCCNGNWNKIENLDCIANKVEAIRLATSIMNMRVRKQI